MLLATAGLVSGHFYTGRFRDKYKTDFNLRRTKTKKTLDLGKYAAHSEWWDNV